MQPNRPMSWAQMSAQNNLVGQQAAESSRGSSGSLSTSTSASSRSQQPGAGSLASVSSAANLEQHQLTSIAGQQQHEASMTSEHQQQQQQQLAENEEQREEENRKLRLQLYVFVLRCISYPFNAKQTNTSDLHPKQQQLKLKKPQLDQIVQLHTRFVRQATSGGFGGAAAVNIGTGAANKTPHQHLKLSGNQLRQLDELYERAHVRFNRKFLQNERMRLLVESECCSQQDLRELFRQNVEQVFRESRIFTSSELSTLNFRRRGEFAAGAEPQLEHEPAGQESSQANLLANREVIMNSWLIKFESIIREDSDGLSSSCSSQFAGELSPTPAPGLGGQGAGAVGLIAPANASELQLQLSKEQLYQMFQNILNIKKFEHQLLYNALQLDSSDEQAAAIRRELDGRIARIAELERNKKLLPKFVLKEMESLYLEESRMSVNKLMVNLDSLPVMKGSSGESRGVYGLQKFRRYNSR